MTERKKHRAGICWMDKDRKDKGKDGYAKDGYAKGGSLPMPGREPPDYI
jgi:hypothetical protein